MSGCDLASQWRTVHYLASSTKVLKYLKFSLMILVLSVSADDLVHACINFFPQLPMV